MFVHKTCESNGHDGGVIDVLSSKKFVTSEHLCYFFNNALAAHIATKITAIETNERKPTNEK